MHARVADVYSFSVGPSDSGISASCLFDRDGVLTATLAMQSDLDIGAALQQLGLSLPGDVSDVLVISNPGVLVVAARAEEAGVSAGEGAGRGLWSRQGVWGQPLAGARLECEE